MPHVRKIIEGGDEGYLGWALAQERRLRKSLDTQNGDGVWLRTDIPDRSERENRQRKTRSERWETPFEPRNVVFEPTASGHRQVKYDMGDGTEVEIRVLPSVSYIVIRGENGALLPEYVYYVFNGGPALSKHLIPVSRSELRPDSRQPARAFMRSVWWSHDRMHNTCVSRSSSAYFVDGIEIQFAGTYGVNDGLPGGGGRQIEPMVVALGVHKDTVLAAFALSYADKFVASARGEVAIVKVTQLRYENTKYFAEKIEVLDIHAFPAITTTMDLSDSSVPMIRTYLLGWTTDHSDPYFHGMAESPYFSPDGRKLGIPLTVADYVKTGEPIPTSPDIPIKLMSSKVAVFTLFDESGAQAVSGPEYVEWVGKPLDRYTTDGVTTTYNWWVYRDTGPVIETGPSPNWQEDPLNPGVNVPFAINVASHQAFATNMLEQRLRIGWFWQSVGGESNYTVGFAEVTSKVNTNITYTSTGDARFEAGTIIATGSGSNNRRSTGSSQVRIGGKTAYGTNTSVVWTDISTYSYAWNSNPTYTWDTRELNSTSMMVVYQFYDLTYDGKLVFRAYEGKSTVSISKPQDVSIPTVTKSHETDSVFCIASPTATIEQRRRANNLPLADMFRHLDVSSLNFAGEKVDGTTIGQLKKEFGVINRLVSDGADVSTFVRVFDDWSHRTIDMPAPGIVTSALGVVKHPDSPDLVLPSQPD